MTVREDPLLDKDIIRANIAIAAYITFTIIWFYCPGNLKTGILWTSIVYFMIIVPIFTLFVIAYSKQDEISYKTDLYLAFGAAQTLIFYLSFAYFFVIEIRFIDPKNAPILIKAFCFGY